MCYKKTPSNQPFSGCIAPLKEWPKMPKLCRHLMTHQKGDISAFHNVDSNLEH